MINYGLYVSLLVLIASLGVSGAPKDQVVYDDDVKLVRFEDLRYPRLAEVARVAGDVVVTVTMNDDGSVMDAVALSGPRLLVDAAIDNARTWRFVPNRLRRAIVVYEFRIEGACGHGGGRSLFRLLHPNVVSVSACGPPVDR